MAYLQISSIISILIHFLGGGGYCRRMRGHQDTTYYNNFYAYKKAHPFGARHYAASHGWHSSGAYVVETNILQYDPEEDKWIHVGDMSQVRGFHAVGVVDWKLMKEFCSVM